MYNYFNGKGTIGFTCDSCGRELNGCSIVNGMKFCAKCYQETFCKDNQQSEIQQLKQQLAEKEKENEELKLKLDIRAMNLQNINTERMEAVRNQTQLAIQELEKVKKATYHIDGMPLNNKFYIDLDLIRNYIVNQIKELKGE